MKRDLGIKNSQSVLIAGYFQLSRFQPAYMDGLLSFIGQIG